VRRIAKQQLARRLVAVQTPRKALAALAIATAALITTAALGPSAAVEPLPGHPPFGWHAHPPAALVAALLAVTVVAGSYGVLGCLAALKRGWALDTKRLLAASFLATLALALLAPVGSSDPGSYVAYGKLAADGHDPYTTPPSALTGSYHAIAEPPWQSTTSVYGPIATGEQWVAAKIAGNGLDAPAHAVFLLGIINAVAFIAAGLLLQLLATSRAGRRRAAVFFSANPVLLFEGVSGAHVDVVVTFLVVAAIAALRPRLTSGLLRWLPIFVAGVLGGAAAAVKASAALAGLGLAWALSGRQRNPVRSLVVLAVGAAAVLVPGYLLAGPHAFDQLRHASGFVSFADPWRIVTHPLEVGLGHDAARAVIRVAAWLAFAVFVLLLDRGLPARPGHVGETHIVGRAHVVAGTQVVGATHSAPNPIGVARAALVLVLGWLLTAPYVLPWYAILAFALLALLPSSGFDRLVVFWTAVLALAYLPGRQVSLPTWLRDVINAWKSGVSPVLLLGAAAVAAVLCLRRRDLRTLGR
ncbi:MAG: hypothetical protein ACRDV3_06055, partial [Acidothermaceae bacterium]